MPRLVTSLASDSNLISKGHHWQLHSYDDKVTDFLVQKASVSKGIKPPDLCRADFTEIIDGVDLTGQRTSLLQQQIFAMATFKSKPYLCYYG